VGRERWLADVIRQQAPDCVVLQEAFRPDVVGRLADATGMAVVAARRGRSVAALSRQPIASHRWLRPRWSQHAFLDLRLAASDLRIVGVHLSAVHAAWTEARRVHELRALLSSIANAVGDRHVVLGDFNTLAPDEAFDPARLPRRLRLLVWLSGGKVRWQTIAIMLGAGYVDCFRQLELREPGSTFPTWDPHVRLDYAFVPRSLAAGVRRCVVIREGPVARASDHFPLLTEIDLDVATDEVAGPTAASTATT
jgi:exodeoxyribonuclease-3